MVGMLAGTLGALIREQFACPELMGSEVVRAPDEDAEDDASVCCGSAESHVSEVSIRIHGSVFICLRMSFEAVWLCFLRARISRSLARRVISASCRLRA